MTHHFKVVQVSETVGTGWVATRHNPTFSKVGIAGTAEGALANLVRAIAVDKEERKRTPLAEDAPPVDDVTQPWVTEALELLNQRVGELEGVIGPLRGISVAPPYTLTTTMVQMPDVHEGGTR